MRRRIAGCCLGVFHQPQALYHIILHMSVVSMDFRIAPADGDKVWLPHMYPRNAYCRDTKSILAKRGCFRNIRICNSSFCMLVKADKTIKQRIITYTNQNHARDAFGWLRFSVMKLWIFENSDFQQRCKCKMWFSSLLCANRSQSFFNYHIAMISSPLYPLTSYRDNK